MAKTSDVVLYFNGEVQIGTTTQKVKFCLNSNADASDSTPHCSAGKFYDQSSATFDISGATIDRRYVRLNPAKDLKVGQKLYVLFPKNAVKDTSSGTNNAGVLLSGNNYYF